MFALTCLVELAVDLCPKTPILAICYCFRQKRQITQLIGFRSPLFVVVDHARLRHLPSAPLVLIDDRCSMTSEVVSGYLRRAKALSAVTYCDMRRMHAQLEVAKAKILVLRALIVADPDLETFGKLMARLALAQREQTIHRETLAATMKEAPRDRKGSICRKCGQVNYCIDNQDAPVCLWCHKWH